MKTVLEKQEIQNRDGKKVFVRQFESEFEDGDWEKNQEFIQNNISALKHFISKMDIDEALKKKEKELDNDYAIKKEAVENFDKYFSDLIKDLKGKKDQMKLQFHAYINKFEEIKQKELEKKREQLSQELEHFKLQLKDEEENIKLYNEEK